MLMCLRWSCDEGEGFGIRSKTVKTGRFGQKGREELE